MIRWFAIGCCVALVGMSGVANAQCLSGTVTAELQTTGPFSGLWKYCLNLTWDTPQGLSNVTFDCGLDACPGAACGAGWFFDDPAGTGTGGEPDSCDFEFTGEFNCNGNPSIGIDYPIIKWDAINDGCEAGPTGMAMLCFYTAAAPQMPEAVVVLIKNGQMVCEGTVTGACPMICPTPIEDATWSRVKSQF